MKKTNFLKTYLYAFFVTLIFSCTKGGSVSYIPYLSASFKNKASAVNDAYFFNVAEDGAYTSSFTGYEDLNYATMYPFSGSFTNDKISFVFTSGPKNGVKYSGKVSGPVSNQIITLNTPEGQIVLSR